MLYPQANTARAVMDLSGFWSFRLHETDPWQTIAVPASYNDLSPDPAFRKHCGLAWYRTRITLPSFFEGQRVVLRFDAVTHSCRVFLNGEQICSHRGGFLPFETELTGLLAPGETAELTVEVDNRINHDTLPIGVENGIAFFGSDNQGITAVEAGKRLQEEKGINRPAFDFFNYAGINRPVRIYTTPKEYIRDVTLIPSLDGTVKFEADAPGIDPERISLTILDAEGRTAAEGRGASGEIRIANPHLWEPRPGTPYLYTAVFRAGGDEYSLPLGIREARVEGNRFLINGKPFRFHGPCKHEDSPFRGRGTDAVVNLTDINLFHWLHANCFRTSHYPYAEEMYSLCDREGIVIVDETPAVGMWADEHYGWNLAEYHAEVLREMIRRDKNHPCVVVWSLGNEPSTDAYPEKARDYWMPLYRLAHEADPQNRPVTLVGCQNIYEKDLTIPAMDIFFINRYYGWYNLSGDLEAAKYALRMELDWWEDRGKPVVLSEYGADTISGLHGAAAEMFTEEFQVAFYEAVSECLDERDFIAGEMPWNFADFSTEQGPMRAGGNRKGLFSRDRRPKMAAHYFRKRWGQMEEKQNGLKT